MVSSGASICRRQGFDQKIVLGAIFGIYRDDNLRHVSVFLLVILCLILIELKISGLVIDQTRKEGFRFRNISESNELQQDQTSSTEEVRRLSGDKKDSDEKRKEDSSVEDIKNE